ncbi:MAG: ABC transporter ATP-binding protein [Clostridia bacterium]|nr:ABC transporter ATP-binding protein [Clostridia bacterium]
MEEIIKIVNLKKYFDTVKAVDDISFSVRKGELFAFLGINGAGKSTTISIMCGTLEKDSGEVFVNGEDIDNSQNFKKSIGVVFQSSVLDKSLSVYDNLKSRASLYGIVGDAFTKRLTELAKLLDFKDIIKRQVSKLSGGQKRKIDIARALLHSPKILVLDEPTTGLDPKTRITIWKVINDLRVNSEMTVFLTTHYMEEAADADYVVIIDSGKIVAKGSPVQLKNEYTADFLYLYDVTEEQVKSLNLPFEKIKDGYKLNVENTAMVTKLIGENPDIFIDYEVTKGKMDSVFLNVTGKALSNGEESK